MPELTRDDVRRACEAVGWKTRDTSSDLIIQTSAGWCGWKALRRVEFAMALLEATGERWQCGRPIGAVESGAEYFALIPGTGHTFAGSIPEAAGRAVLAWKEARDA